MRVKRKFTCIVNMVTDSCAFLLPSLQITTDDLLQAAQMEERGMLDRIDRSDKTWKQVAINEAAMAVVAVNFPDLKNIEFVCSLRPKHFLSWLVIPIPGYLCLKGKFVLNCIPKISLRRKGRN